MNTPTVSIIIPAYNVEGYIQECVKSLLSQTYQDYEIIIVDDGSKDGTPALLDKISFVDARIKVFHKSNGGATSARKYGVERALGKWILFVDADDTMPEDAVNDLILHDNGTCDIIAGTIFYQSKNLIIKTNTSLTTLTKEEYIHLLLNRQTYYGPCSKLIKRCLFNELEWEENGCVFQNEDLLMLVKLAVKSTKKILIRNDHIHYVCVDKPSSMSTRPMSYGGWKILLNDLEKTILSGYEDESVLFHDYLNYALWALYNHLLYKAINIPQDAFLTKIVTYSMKICIDDENKKAVRLLSNPIERKIFCLYRRIRKKASKFRRHFK